MSGYCIFSVASSIILQNREYALNFIIRQKRVLLIWFCIGRMDSVWPHFYPLLRYNLLWSVEYCWLVSFWTKRKTRRQMNETDPPGVSPHSFPNSVVRIFLSLSDFLLSDRFCILKWYLYSHRSLVISKCEIFGRNGMVIWYLYRHRNIASDSQTEFLTSSCRMRLYLLAFTHILHIFQFEDVRKISEKWKKWNYFVVVTRYRCYGVG